ncbi:MAG: alpha/beta hydrolase [Clostridia bacterium]|nr:alpha/beta hydrolase [Clostridia bacterium]
MLYLFLGIAVLLLIVVIAAANFLINTSIRRQPPLPPHDPETLPPFWQDYIARNNAALAALDTLPHEVLTLNAHDGVSLRARFFPIAGNGSGQDTVIVVHGYRSSAGDFAMMIPWYRAQNFNVLVAENRAHGGSAGDFVGFGALDRIDCAAWCRLLAERMPDRAIFLHGISMGAATVTLTACHPLPPQVKGVIADCGYSSAVAEFRHVMHSTMHIPRAVSALLMPVASLFCRLRAGYFFGDADPLRALAHAHLPILFVHGGKDDYVPTEMAYRLYDACPTDKALLIVDDATHGVSYAIDPSRYEAAMRAFYAKHRPADEGAS